MATTSTLNEKRVQSRHSEEEAAESSKNDTADRLAFLRSSFENYVHVVFGKLRTASAQDISALRSGLAHVPEEDIDGWIAFLESSQQTACETRENLENILLTALSDKVIGTKTVRDMIALYEDPSRSFKNRQAFVTKTLTRYDAKWRATMAQRNSLVKDERIAQIPPGRVPDMGIFRDAGRFADLTYHERKGLLAHIEAALSLLETADTRMEKLYDETQSELTGYERRGILHRSKIGTWLERTFKGAKNPEQVERFLKEVLRPYAINWAETREDFDTLEHTLSSLKEIPRGFKRLSPGKFLLLDYKQRTSYCALAWLRLEDSDVSQEQNTVLAALKLRIRYNLDTEDWEGADRCLQKACLMDPKDRELLSMQTYLSCHRPKNPEELHPNPKRTLEHLRGLVRQLPGEMQPLYIRGMQEGPAVLHRLLQVMGNRVWVHEHIGITEADERKQAQDRKNRQQTKMFMSRGHSNDLEHNVLLADTAEPSAIRDDCVSPQMLYYEGGDATEAIFEKIKQHPANDDGVDGKLLSESERFGYNTTVVPLDIPYALHATVVKNLHREIKRGVAKLHEQGYRFTLSGELLAA